MGVKQAAGVAPSIRSTIRLPMRPMTRLRRPRRIASVMLFVWLFATVASWAHACLVQPLAATAESREHRPHQGAGTALRGDHHAAAAAGETGAPDAARQACASFCETEQNLVAKAQPSKGDGGADLAVAPPAALAGWPANGFRAEPRRRAPAAPAPPGPPVALAFLRLTL
jgi:hypothetical protein